MSSSKNSNIKNSNTERLKNATMRITITIIVNNLRSTNKSGIVNIF